MIRGSFAAAIAVTIAVEISLCPSPSVGAAARAGDIQVLSADVFTGVLDELARSFERATGHTIRIVYGTAGATRDPQAANALIRFLWGPAAASVFKAKGMDPG